LGEKYNLIVEAKRWPGNRFSQGEWL